MIHYILAILFALALAGYGLLIQLVRSGTHFYLVWYVLAALAFCICYFWPRIPAAGRILIGALLALGVLVSVLIGSRILKTFQAEGSGNLPYIIVLGAQVREDGPAKALRYRLDRAYEYLQENPDTICICSGGQGKNEPWSEAEGMARYLMEKGIPETRILKEDQSTTTAENLKFSLKLLPSTDTPVGIITNNFHVYRAVEIAKQQGLTHAEGIAAGSTPLYLPNNILREFLAVLKYWI